MSSPNARLQVIENTNYFFQHIPYSQSSNTVAIESNITLGKKESAVLFVTVTVKEPNLSLDCLRNGAIPTDTAKNILSKAGVMTKFHEEKRSK